MAIDKAIDSSLLDGALSASADAIRAKTGDVKPIPFDVATGFAAAISAIAAGGGTLGIKSGTVTLSSSYGNIYVEHGCGKLPYLVVLYPISEYVYSVNNITGAYWFSEHYAMMFIASMVTPVNANKNQYKVATDEPPGYGIYVTTTAIKCVPSLPWMAGTYKWIAIYEV